jgi:hypothetical protein
MMMMANAAAAFLAAAGSGTVWGIETETGLASTAEAVDSSAQSIGSGPVGLVDAVAGVTIAAITALNEILSIAFAAPTLFTNLGVPGFITGFVFAPLYVMVAIDIIAILRGDSGI